MIFYFSGTGNTLWAARQLAQATGEKLVPMARSLPSTSYRLAEGERLGFCFPVHGWQPPKLVRHFLASLKIENVEGHYCYALCTCGDTVGLAMDLFIGLASKRGIHVDSRFSLVMPESYVALPFMLTDTPRRERCKLLISKRKLQKVKVIVEERQAGVDDVRRGGCAWLLTHIVGAAFNRWFITDKPFRLDKGKCARCSRCVAACPLDNMMTDGEGHPLWKRDGRCAACLSCYHHCPRHAINHGPLTRSRGQYFYGKHKESVMD